MNESFPNGYTVVCTWGKTRTFYSMLKYKDSKGKSDPGKMDVKDYAKVILPLYGEHILRLKSFGVSDIILTMLHYEAWQSRGEEYIKLMLLNMEFLISDFMIEIYNQGFSPYFIGLDQIYKFYKKNSEEYKIAKKLEDFERKWKRKEGDVYLGIEMFPVTTSTVVDDLLQKSPEEQMEFQKHLKSAKDPVELENILYEWKSKLLCKGRILPKDGCLLGSNYNGDLHMRSALAAEFIHHKRFRMFYYPGPSLQMTKKAYERMFEDILNPKKAKMRVTKTDYSGEKTISEWESEINRVEKITKNPDNLVGLLR